MKTCTSLISSPRAKISDLKKFEFEIIVQGLTGVKSAAEFMKEHAMEFQMDTDKFDAVRLALNASRNNSYSLLRSEKKKRMVKKISKKSFLQAHQKVDGPEGLPSPPAEVDFIPPSCGLASQSGRFSPMGVLSAPCLSDDRVFEGPVFVPLSEDSPFDRIASHCAVAQDNNPTLSIDSRSATPFHPDDIRLNETEHGLSPETDGDEEEDLDYFEAAHYANDLRTTHLLVAGAHQPSIIPLDAYLRRASMSVRNFSDAILSQGHAPHTVFNSTAMVSGEYVTADNDTPNRL